MLIRGTLDICIFDPVLGHQLITNSLMAQFVQASFVFFGYLILINC